MKKDIEIKVGSVWFAVDMAPFIVTKVQKDNGKTWIFYKQFKPLEKVNTEYSCYQEAFVLRFFEFTNIRHSLYFCGK